MKTPRKKLPFFWPILTLVIIFTSVSCLKEPGFPTGNTGNTNNNSGTTNNTSTNTGNTNTGGTNTGGGTNNGGSNNTGNKVKTGTFKVRIYKPDGECESDPKYGFGTPRAFIGHMGGQVYDQNGTPTYWGGFGTSNAPSYSTSKSYWDYTINNCDKITWELWPNRSSWPNHCTIRGEVSIDYQGQVKDVVIKWN